LGLKTVCSNQSDPSKFRAARQRKPAGREPTASLPENPAWFLIAGQPIERDMAKSIRDNPKKASRPSGDRQLANGRRANA